MKSAATPKRPVAFEVTLKDGRSAVEFATNGGTAKHRVASAHRVPRSEVKGFVRRKDLDHLAPETDQRRSMGKPPRPGVKELEALNPGFRVCYRCNKLLPEAEFHCRDKSKNRECRCCRSERWLNLPVDKRIRQILSVAKHRAEKKGIPFDLEPQDIAIPERCPVLGITLSFSKVETRHSSPSIDRIKPELGYTKGNVVVVSWLANDIRRNFEPEDIIRVGEFYKNLLSTAHCGEL